MFDNGLIEPAWRPRKGGGKWLLGLNWGDVFLKPSHDGQRSKLTFGVWDLTLPARASEP